MTRLLTLTVYALLATTTCLQAAPMQRLDTETTPNPQNLQKDEVDPTDVYTIPEGLSEEEVDEQLDEMHATEERMQKKRSQE